MLNLTKEQLKLKAEIVEDFVAFAHGKGPHTREIIDVLMCSESTQVRKSISMGAICKDLSKKNFICLVFAIRDNSEVDSIGRKLKGQGCKTYEISSRKNTPFQEFIDMMQEGFVFYTHVDANRLRSKALQNFYEAAKRLSDSYYRADFLDDSQEYMINKDFSALSNDELTALKTNPKKMPSRDVKLEMGMERTDIAVVITTTVASQMYRKKSFDKVYELIPPPDHAGFSDISHYSSEKNNDYYRFNYLVNEEIPQEEPIKSLFDDGAFSNFIINQIDRKKLQHILACVGGNTRDLFEVAVGTALDIAAIGHPHGVLVCSSQVYDPEIRANTGDVLPSMSPYWEVIITDDGDIEIKNLNVHAQGETFQHAASYMTKKYQKFITFDFEMISKMSKSPVDLEGLNPATVLYNTRFSKTPNGQSVIQRSGRVCGDYPDINKTRYIICPKDRWDYLQIQLSDNRKLIKFFKDTEGLPYNEFDEQRTKYLQLNGKNHTTARHQVSHNIGDNSFKDRYKSEDEFKKEHPDTHLITRQITVDDFEPPGEGSKNIKTILKKHILPSFIEWASDPDISVERQCELLEFRSLLEKAIEMTDINFNGESIRNITDDYYSRYYLSDRRAMSPSFDYKSPEAWNRIMCSWVDYGLVITIVHPDYDYSKLMEHHTTSYASHDLDDSILYFCGDQSTGVHRRDKKKSLCEELAA
jgi:hypothetical protein